jgi:predicted phage terminase large subunit-like protein
MTTLSQKPSGLSVKAAAAILAAHKRRVEKTLSFERWLPAVSPTFNWSYRHIAYLQEHLDKVTRGEIKRLMIFMPPRHFKSETVTVRYAAWHIERNPATRIIVGAYNQTLAEKFSRKTRRIIRSRPVSLSKERTASEDWETEAGGGLRAVGVGGGVTGQGGNGIIIDDPVKNREEANSETYRNKVWEWYTDDLYTRLEPDAWLILIMTRWHQDDLAGRILASENAANWTVINLPAEAEDGDPLGRQLGEALCPERFDEQALEDIHREIGNSYYALYQQRPLPAEGGMFKRDKFEIVGAAPIEGKRVRFWDKAASKGAGDWTVGVRMLAAHNGTYFIEDVVRGQWEAHEREAVMRQTAQLDGIAVKIMVEQEPGSGGKESAQATIRNLAGFNVEAKPSTGDKTVRAEAFAAQQGAGNVYLVKGDWNANYIEELCAFPSGKHDDQVDASSGAFNGLVKVYAPAKVTRYA